MGAGAFRFELRVLEKGVEVARGERKFTAITGTRPAVPGSPGPG
jgi:hypothetical protein